MYSAPFRTCLVSAALLFSGCIAPSVTVDGPLVRWFPNASEPRELQILSTINTSNLLNEQLLYRVNLYTADGQVVQSSDQRFQDARGRVAAQRTLMVLRSPWTFENQILTIPVEQLEIRPDVVPAKAEVSVERPDGTQLVRSMVDLPPSTVLPAPVARKSQRAARSSRTASAERAPRTSDQAEQSEPPRPRRAAPPRTRAGDGAVRDTSEGGEKAGSAEPPRSAVRDPVNSRTNPRTGTRTSRTAPTARSRQSRPGASSEPRSTERAAPRTPPPAADRIAEENVRSDDSAPRASGEAARESATPTEPPLESERDPRAEDSATETPTQTRSEPDSDSPPARRRSAAAASQPVAREPGATADDGPRRGETPPRGSATRPAEDVRSSRLQRERDSTSRPVERRRDSRRAADKSEAQVYVVQTGDTLSGIAAKVLGDPDRWPEIYLMNRDRLDSPDDLRVGHELRVPLPPATSQPAEVG